MLRVVLCKEATMAQSANTSDSRDAFDGLREMRDAYLNVMSKAMIDLVNSDAYTKSTGDMLEGYLAWATPFRETLDSWMRQTLEQMSLPSRQEVAALAERFTHIEMRLDDLDAKLDSKLDARLDEIARSIAQLSAEVRAAAVSQT